MYFIFEMKDLFSGSSIFMIIIRKSPEIIKILGISVKSVNQFHFCRNCMQMLAAVFTEFDMGGKSPALFIVTTLRILLKQGHIPWMPSIVVYAAHYM